MHNHVHDLLFSRDKLYATTNYININTKGKQKQNLNLRYLFKSHRTDWAFEISSSLMVIDKINLCITIHTTLAVVISKVKTKITSYKYLTT